MILETSPFRTYFMRLLISCATAIILLTGCHHGHCAEKKLNIVAATFPVYIFTKNVCAGVNDIDLQLLVPASAGCPHDFALKPADIQKLSRADILIINGAGLEEFLAKPLDSLERKPFIIDAGTNVPVLEALNETDHQHVNPHIFAAPAEAALMTANIGQKLADRNPANAETYLSNSRAYADKLVAISEQFRQVGKKAANRGIAIEHDALAYMAQNADLVIVASLESNASAGQIAQTKKILQNTSPALLAGDSQYPDRLLKALAQETGIPFAQLNPCASGPDEAPQDYYERIMRENLGLLEKYFD